MESVVIVLIIVVLAMMRYAQHIKHGYQYVDRQAAPVKAKVLPVPQAYRDILQKYFKYYQALSPSAKLTFERKVTLFVYSKQFIPRMIDSITLEAKVLIAASAVQLTFGLPDHPLQHFNKILVYPNDYYSGITKRYHKGEVNPRFGIIVLSWQSFIDGYINPNDAFNVGLHEMAHALRLESMMREESQVFDENLFDTFDDYADHICLQMEIIPNKIIRPYACTNRHEFFSVAVENFFERPAQFKAELPEVYGILGKLLRQDPLNLK
ncbi:zinc-dependent peptidase [Pseudochryseolinea flava]|uniref:DgsA anti-repressor MtfA n=1 Tax=Pseudochryseolinea flava TaxID=2059302 RepID=A0A364Y721_9BACT|nr:zinc-dependent peptidase [Pseudochryseolinea flava]RAW02777.1 DgsA anti-repressor MtfA [Pseudochryseolinea flava]